MYNPKYIYVEGGRRTYRLTPEGEQMFRSRFPITPAKDIAHELGCGIDMVYKLANSYGVKKDPTYKRETLRRVMLHARTYYVKDKEANPELYQERFQERGRRICRQRRTDELRIMSGEKPRYNFYFAPAHSKKKRTYARRCVNLATFLTLRAAPCSGTSHPTHGATYPLSAEPRSMALNSRVSDEALSHNNL